MQYRVIMETSDHSLTPTLYDIDISLSLGIQDDSNSEDGVSIEVHSNPSFGETVIFYDIATRADVSINVFDLTGRNQYSEVFENSLSGSHTLNLGSFAPGLYFCSVYVNDLSDVISFVVTE